MFLESSVAAVRCEPLPSDTTRALVVRLGMIGKPIHSGNKSHSDATNIRQMRHQRPSLGFRMGHAESPFPRSRDLRRRSRRTRLSARGLLPPLQTPCPPLLFPAGGPDRNRTCTYGFGGHRPIHWTTGPVTLRGEGKPYPALHRLARTRFAKCGQAPTILEIETPSPTPQRPPPLSPMATR